MLALFGYSCCWFIINFFSDKKSSGTSSKKSEPTPLKKPGAYRPPHAKQNDAVRAEVTLLSFKINLFLSFSVFLLVIII